MHAPLPARARALRLAAAAFAAGLVLSVAPLPTPSFVAVAVAETASTPSFSDMPATSLAAQRAASEEPIGAERVSAVEASVEEFNLIGVTLDAEPDEPVLVRVREDDGAWGEWNEVEVDVDLGPDPGTPESQGSVGVVTEPIWVGSASGFEVSVAPDDTDHVGVTVVRERTRRVVAESTPLSEAAVAAPFAINSRASWGARAPSSTPSIASGGVKLAVVHHTAGSNNYSAAQVPGILRSVQAYHMGPNGNGWSDIGYNFLVDKFGGIWEGRAGGTANAVIGAHAMGFNTGSVGVSVLGNYVGVASSAAAREAVSKVVGYRLQDKGVNPTARANVTSGGSSTIPAGRVVNLPTVVGHRDVGSTSCPGSIYDHLGSIRNRALDWYTWVDVQVSPGGAISAVTVSGNRVDVVGWARDPDVAAAARVHVVIAGRLSEVHANGYRPDVAKMYPGYGENLGWGTSFSGLEEGSHRVCVTVINQGDGNDKLLGCRDVVVK